MLLMAAETLSKSLSREQMRTAKQKLPYCLKKHTIRPVFADDNDVTDGYGRACPCRSGHARILLIPIRRAGHDKLRAAGSRHSEHFALISEPEIGGTPRMDSVATT
jgi:hypothetical protein